MLCKQCSTKETDRKGGVCYSCVAKRNWAKKERTLLIKNCVECSAPFKVQRSQTKERKKIVNGKIFLYRGGRFCSRKCFSVYFKKNIKTTLGKTWKHSNEYRSKLSDARKGVRNPAFIHGEYSGAKRRGLTLPQQQWRRKIYERDKFTCQMCGVRNGSGKTTKLQAHHICPWGLFAKLRYRLSNGVTLCVGCHKRTHDFYKERLEQEPSMMYQQDWYIEHYERLNLMI